MTALSSNCSTIGTPTALRLAASSEPTTIAPELTILFAATVRAACAGIDPGGEEGIERHHEHPAGNGDQQQA